MKFKFIKETKIEIFNDKDEKVGQIFSPSGSRENCINAIQICGFTEAFDLWSCGVYKHKKDIQLLFDNIDIQGEFNPSLDGCCKCFHDPCGCEDRKIGDIVKLFKELTKDQRDTLKRLREEGDIEKQVNYLIDCQGKNPFTVKRERDLIGRIKYKSGSGGC